MNINFETKRLIIEYLETKGITLSTFSRRAGVHQAQMWIFLYGNTDRGLHGRTIEKIGKYLIENP